MNHGMFERQGMESQRGAQKGVELDVCQQVIDVNEGHICGSFAAVDSDVAHLHLHMQRDYMKAANLGMAAGDPLDFSYQPSANVSLEGIGCDVP